jgi:hypothetical protein
MLNPARLKNCNILTLLQNSVDEAYSELFIGMREASMFLGRPSVVTKAVSDPLNNRIIKKWQVLFLEVLPG